MNKVAQQNKKTGFIRWEAIVPAFVIFSLTVGYFHFFFDRHLKSAIEWAGYQAAGAEVNVADVKTSFFKATLSIKGIDITDADQPNQNSISIGEIRYGMLWDALLRVKFVIEEAAVEKIEFNKPRSKPGKVKPPEPIDNSPSLLEKEGAKLANKALDQVEDKYQDNVLGNVAALLGGGSSGAQLDKLDAQLISKQKAKDLENRVNAKKSEWEAKLKSLPQADDFQKLGNQLSQVKTSGFSSPEELQKSLSEIDRLFKEADAKYKELQNANSSFNNDLGTLQSGLKDLEQQIKTDVKELEKHFKIPQLDAKSIAMSLFLPYVQPYKDKLLKYKALFYKYAPPNVVNKDNEPEIAIQPRPRSKGVNYEFGRPNSYPLFWIKKTAVSSQAGASPYSGFIQGQITDISTNQLLTGKPTVVQLKGDFPAAEVSGFSTLLTIDNRKAINQIALDLAIQKFPVGQKNLVNSDDVMLGFNKADGSTVAKVTLADYKNFDLQINNQFQNIEYLVSAKQKIADEVLKKIFNDITLIDLNFSSSGVLPRIDFNISSSIGTQIQRGLQKEVEAQIAIARKRINDYVNAEVTKNKQAIEAQLAQLKAQIDNEIKKLQQQAESEKKKAESKTDQAKKDAENQAKSKIEQEGKKAVEDLKKKFGL